MKDTHILDLIDVKFLQNLQDFFANTMEVASLTIDRRGPVTKPSNFTEFCAKQTRGSSIGVELCNDCDIKWGEIAAKKGEPVIYNCHAGLTDFAVPVTIEGRHIATILCGQVLTEPPNEVRFREIARNLGIDEDEYIEEVKKIKIIPAERIKATARFLHVVANSVSAIAYANIQLAKAGLTYKKPRNIIMEDWFYSNREQVEKPITEREFEVLKLIVLGESNTEIAQKLFISVHTVKKHVSSILQKLLVEDRVQVAVKAVREGLI